MDSNTDANSHVDAHLQAFICKDVLIGNLGIDLTQSEVPVPNGENDMLLPEILM